MGFACTFYRQATLQSFFQSGSKGGYWYLWVLAVFYLVLNLFRYVGTGKKGIICDIGYSIIVYLIFSLILKIFKIPGENDIFSIGRCASMWPYFILGYFTRKYELLKYLRKHSLIASFSAVVFIFIYFGIIRYFGWILGRFYKLASISILIFLLYLFSNREERTTKIEDQLSFVGRYSLEVYIFHYFFLYNINISFVQSWAINTNNGFLELLFIITVSIIITYMSIFVGWLFHQEKWLQRIVYGG